MIGLFKNVSLYIIQKMCIRVIWVCPCLLEDIPDQYRTWEMYIKVADFDPWRLDRVPDHFKSREMCEIAVEKYPGTEICPRSS